MPWQPRKYRATMSPRSSQLTPQPQASGTAATRAANGIVMKSSSVICSTDLLWSPPNVADGSEASAASGAALAVEPVIASELAVMRGVPRRAGGRLRSRNLRRRKYGRTERASERLQDAARHATPILVSVGQR